MSRPRLLLLILLAVGGIAWLVERLVVTDAEAIGSAVTRLASSASAKDWEAFEALLADDFDSPWGDRAKFTRMLAELMKRYDVKDTGVRLGDVTVRGDRGAAAVTALPGAPFQGLRVQGRVDLVRTDDGWRVVGVTSDDASAGWRRVR